MMDLSSKHCLVYDHGLFWPLAQRLKREFGKVTYFAPWQRGFPSYHELDVGSGFDDIERAQSFWEALPKADIVVFPDILCGDLQVYLREQGHRVWGSGKGEDLELYRYFGKRVLEAVDLPVQPYRIVKGTDALREYLKKHSDKFVKVSLLRGITETFCAEKFWMIEPRLDELEHSLGARKNITEFIIEDPVETNLEYGYDGICVDGQFPSIAATGVERKDECLIAVVQDYENLPAGILLVNERLAPVLKGCQYRNFFSTEIREAKDGTPYMIDPCCRHPTPSGEAQQELWGNLGEMIWHGASGELVDPEPTGKYAVEAIIYSDRADDSWQPVEVPEKFRDNVKLFYHCRIKEHDFVIPQAVKMNEIGAVVAVADELGDAVKKCEEIAKLVKGDKIEVRTKAIADAVKEFEEMESKGIDLTPMEAASQA